MYLHNKLLRMLCVHLLQQDTMQYYIMLQLGTFFLLIIGLLTHGIYQIISNHRIKTQGLLRRRAAMKE